METTLKPLNVDKELRDYQKRYYEKMADSRPLHSLICIPTGGGKTRLATVFLINNALANEQKVLWITHSQYLLNQAYDTFSNYLDYEWMSEFSILIHSGNHDRAIVQKTSDINIRHRLIFCSFQSLQKAKTNWKDIIGENTFIVIDEAHHIVAPSYYDLIETYISDKNLIGLTATPVRTKKLESSQLYGIFYKDLGIRIHMTELFQKQYLVRPLFEIVNYSNEQLETSDIGSIDELDNWLVENSKDYNERIVDKYLSAPSKYGKTVIFAINKCHADSLYEAFCERYDKEKVFLVYSDLRKTESLPSLQNGETRETQFKEFKDSKDGILININVLNEGVDIPDIQTVFLTKPLNSRIAVTQIIGRALRNPDKEKYPNKKCAYIINFAVSNLGRKILMVMPKTAYSQYSAEWESEEAADEYEENEERVSELEEIAEKAKRKAEICSFSDICLAGNYTLISRDEQEEIPVPVSFKEYRKIKRFRSGLSCNFPKRLFFNDIDAEVIQKAFENEGSLYDITFKPYDEELLAGITDLISDMKSTVKDYYDADKKRKDYIDAFAMKYRELQKEGNAIILWYLGQVGIRSEKDFIYFMKQELPEIKKELKEDM